MNTGAVILHYRFWPGVASCLEHLQSQSVAPARVILVDNYSADGSVGEIRAAFPWVEVLELPHNAGYSAGMNAGLRILADAGGGLEAVVLLTHDCALGTRALERLARRLEERPSLGAVGPALGLHADPERLYAAGGFVDPRTWDPRHIVDPRMPEIDSWLDRPPHDAQWLDGACVLLRLAAFRQVGLLDQRYFLYYEDVDYCLRLGAAGWAIECVPSAQAWHDTARPSPLLQYLDNRNRLVFVFEHAAVWFRVRQVVRTLAWIFRDLAAGEPDRTRLAHIRWSALVDFTFRRLGCPGPGPEESGSRPLQRRAPP